MSVDGIASKAGNTIIKRATHGIGQASKKKAPYSVSERYITQKKLDNLKIELDSLEREESLIARPNDRALKAIGRKITDCLERIASLTEYLKCFPEIH